MTDYLIKIRRNSLRFTKCQWHAHNYHFRLLIVSRNLRMIQICLAIPWWAILFVIYWICSLFLISVNFIIFIWFNHRWDGRWIMFDLWLNLKHFVDFWINLASGFYIYHHSKMIFQISIITIWQLPKFISNIKQNEKEKKLARKTCDCFNWKTCDCSTFLIARQQLFSILHLIAFENKVYKLYLSYSHCQYFNRQVNRTDDLPHS